MILPRKHSYGVRVYRANGYEWVGSFAFKEYGGKREAKKAAEEAERKAMKRRGKRMTVNQLVELYLAGYSGKVTSFNTVKVRVAYLTKHLGESYVDDLTPIDAIEWKGKVPAYCLPTATAVFNWANRKWITDKNPFASLAEPSKGRSEDAPPTQEEFAALLEACSVLGSYAPQMRALMRFAFGSGMRPGELFMLEWEPRLVTHKGITAPCSHIDLESQSIHVNWRISQGDIDIPKSNEKREIALTPPAAEALVGHDRRSNYVFVSKTGKQLSAATLSGYWNLVLAKAGSSSTWYTATKHCRRPLHVDGPRRRPGRHRGADGLGPRRGRGTAEGLRPPRGRLPRPHPGQVPRQRRAVEGGRVGMSVYGVDTPRAGESVLRLDVTYRVRGWGHDGIEYGVDWNALTNDERIELDRLLWKSRERIYGVGEVTETQRSSQSRKHRWHGAFDPAAA
jgi:integrase